tara:strand:+ start:389 stop:751 length:363 start_codon:yes stop_codon:yes gene_type:complete
MSNTSYILIPSYPRVVSTETLTPTSIIICKARPVLINPPIEPMRKHEYKSIEIYTCRATFIKSILYRLAFSVFNLPCCCIETPFGSNFYKPYKPKVIQTKPYKGLYFNNNLINKQEVVYG